MAIKKQTIELTKKQFEALIKAVFLGNWMVNAYRDGSLEDPHIHEYENIEEYFFSLAPQFGLEKYMNHSVDDVGKHYPSNFFEETTDVHKLHEVYDEENFWDELAERLGERDFIKKYSREEIKKMSEKNYFEKLYKSIDRYSEEFEKLGLERMVIKG